MDDLRIGTTVIKNREDLGRLLKQEDHQLRITPDSLVLLSAYSGGVANHTSRPSLRAAFRGDGRATNFNFFNSFNFGATLELYEPNSQPNAYVEWNEEVFLTSDDKAIITGDRIHLTPVVVRGSFEGVPAFISVITPEKMQEYGRTSIKDLSQIDQNHPVVITARASMHDNQNLQVMRLLPLNQPRQQQLYGILHPAPENALEGRLNLAYRLAHHPETLVERRPRESITSPSVSEIL